jgi:hypothetical protein
LNTRAASRRLAAALILVSAGAFASACASAETIRAPAWSDSADPASCEAVSGAYVDRAVERIASRDGLAMQSLGSLMRFHRADQTPLLLPPYSQTACFLQRASRAAWKWKTATLLRQRGSPITFACACG